MTRLVEPGPEVEVQTPILPVALAYPSAIVGRALFMSDQHVSYVRGQDVIVKGEGGTPRVPEHDFDPFFF